MSVSRTASTLLIRVNDGDHDGDHVSIHVYDRVNDVIEVGEAHVSMNFLETILMQCSEFYSHFYFILHTFFDSPTHST